MNLERSCCVGELQPILQPIRDYLPKNYHYFFKEQKDEKYKKKETLGQVSFNSLFEVITGAFDSMYTMIMPFKDRAVSA